jgi:protein phosphatase
MVQAGEITRDEAEVHPHRNVLLRALGTEPKVDVDADDIGLLEGDRVVLCSDGLTTMVAEDQILAILDATPGKPQDAADRLVRAANRAGGIDNITVIVLDVEAGDPDEGTVAAAPVVSIVRPRRRWWPWIVGAIAGLLLLGAAFTVFRSYVDKQWYVGVSNGHVAIYQGIPASPFGFDLSHVDLDTELDAAAVEQLATFPGLREGINVESREAALATVEQMRQDLQQQDATP